MSLSTVELLLREITSLGKTEGKIGLNTESERLSSSSLKSRIENCWAWLMLLESDIETSSSKESPVRLKSVENKPSDWWLNE